LILVKQLERFASESKFNVESTDMLFAFVRQKAVDKGKPPACRVVVDSVSVGVTQ